MEVSHDGAARRHGRLVADAAAARRHRLALAQGVRHSTYGRDSLPTRRRAAEPRAFRSQRLRQLLGPRSRDLTGDRERRLMGPQGRKHVYRMHHREPLSAVL